MQKLDILSLLYDFYGGFLTKKQQQLFELYYFNDFSLGEIADHYSVSRQAVYDIIKRAENILLECEEKLALQENFIYQKNKLEKIRSLLALSYEKYNKEELKAALQCVEELIDHTINS